MSNGVVKKEAIVSYLEANGIVVNTVSVVNGTTVGTHITASALAQLPDPVGNVISITSAITIIGNLDLQGNRLVMTSQAALIGTSSETCSLSSTGLPSGEALLTSSFSLPIRNITLACPSDCSIFDLNGDGTNGLDISNVNFGSSTLSVGDIGVIANYSNFIAFNCAVLNVLGNGFTFDGSFGTIAFNQCLFGATLGATDTHITLPNTLTVTRRFRCLFSSFIVLPGRTGIDFNPSSIPNSNFILNNVNFTSSGTFVNGTTAAANSSAFDKCVGIENSAEHGSYAMNNNAVVTTISLINTFYIVAGTTTPSTHNQRFDHTSNNVLTYVGVVTSTFFISAVASVLGGNNKIYNMAIYKNGALISDSVQAVTTDGTGRATDVKSQSFTTLEQNDYISIYTANTSGTSDITFEHLNVVVFAI